MIMEHVVDHQERDPLTTVALCTCGLSAVSVNLKGCMRILRRKHRHQRIRARARERARG